MKTNKISLSDVSIENNQEDLEKIKEFFLEKINADPEVQKIIKNLNVSKEELTDNIDVFLNFLDQEPNAKFLKIIIRDPITNALKIKLVESQKDKSEILEKYIFLKEISQLSAAHLSDSFKENFLKQINNEVKRNVYNL